MECQDGTRLHDYLKSCCFWQCCCVQESTRIWWPRLRISVMGYESTQTTVCGSQCSFVRSLFLSFTSFPYLCCFPSRILRYCNVLHTTGRLAIRSSVSTVTQYTRCLFFVCLSTPAVSRCPGGFKPLCAIKATSVRYAPL
jgi:hypothetical protein